MRQKCFKCNVNMDFDPISNRYTCLSCSITAEKHEKGNHGLRWFDEEGKQISSQPILDDDAVEKIEKEIEKLKRKK